MKASKFIFPWLPVVAWACGTSDNGGSQRASGSPGGTGAQSGASASGSPSSGAGTGDANSSGGGSGSASGVSNGAPNGGSTGGPSGGSIHFDGGVNMIPAGYLGTPFATNTIPGFIY